MKTLNLYVLFALMALSAFASNLCATTITVNSLSDAISGNDGQCTLSEAILSANNNTASTNPGECDAGELAPVIDQIVFEAGLNGTITLSSTLPSISEIVRLSGPGKNDLTIDASGISGTILAVNSETVIEGLTITGGGDTGTGGAITSMQPLTVLDCRFESNDAGTGGAIFANHDLTVERSEFRDNQANQFSAGAIRLANADKQLIVRDSLFENNQTTVDALDGGAIQVGGSGHVTVISGSTFKGNVVAASNQPGGALRIGGSSLTITNSTFTGNRAGRDGGAIYSGAGTSTLINVTVTGNTADASDDGNGDGGGVFSFHSMSLRNSLLADNTDSGGEAPDCGSSVDFTSEGFNLIGVGAGCFGISDGVNGDQVGTVAQPIDPLIAVLDDNGGPTPTQALLPGSPAIDAGNPAGCTDAIGDPLLVDQRGSPRPADGNGEGTAVCDVGAFEAAADSVFRDRFEN